jgi:hypothetical protein
MLLAQSGKGFLPMRRLGLTPLCMLRANLVVSLLSGGI